jgi:hypothetical protein
VACTAFPAARFPLSLNRNLRPRAGTDRAIQRLEEELGGPLLHRERNLTQLTALGRAMLPHLEADAAAFRRRKGEPLRLGIDGTLSARMSSFGPQDLGSADCQTSRCQASPSRTGPQDCGHPPPDVAGWHRIPSDNHSAWHRGLKKQQPEEDSPNKSRACMSIERAQMGTWVKASTSCPLRSLPYSAEPDR